MIAIVIPYYKHTFFEEALQSLASQTDKRFNVYIGDDASPENPKELIEKYNEQLNIKYLRFDNNLGSTSLTQQWKRCIDLIEGEEWILLLGDDDYLGDNVIESWYSNLEVFKEKSNVIRFSTKVKNEKAGTISKTVTHPIWEKPIDSYYRRFKGKSRSSLSEYIFSTTSYNKFGFAEHPLAWHSDDRMWLEYSENKDIYTINDAQIYIRTSEINISGKQDNFDLKNMASIQFYKYLVSNKLTHLNKNKKLEFILQYESSIKKVRELKMDEWKFLGRLYLKYFKVIYVLKYSKRFLKSRFI
ncbi:MAG: glycosyl transferase [Lutibacter sp.]|nr:MAG: glycosyl transferase [Lutibacter sp.]